MRRRTLIAASAVAVAGVAGCSSGSGNETGSSAGGSTEERLTSRVNAFYESLFGEDSIGDANAMYHPESPAPELTPADFEPHGGVEAIQADVAKVEVVAQEGNTARVHVDVNYTSAIGSAVNTDWFTFRKDGDEWDVNMWLPQSRRTDLSEETVEEAMSYNRTDAE